MMKVLLTGGSGFVGSHILDVLRARGLATVVLLRPTSNRRFLQSHLPATEVRAGSVGEPESLRHALADVTHVIHCAGRTRATRSSEFYDTNHQGTRNVVEAVNVHGASVQRLVHISSLAVAGPATPSRPAQEEDPPHPVSEYGKSKLAGELEVPNRCRTPYTILRPPAVYGPRDSGFLPMFRAVKHHLLPRPSSKQMLSLVFVRDLAEATVRCLDNPVAAGKTYFVASGELTTGRQMAAEIAEQMEAWTLPCPLPAAVLWPLCLALEAWSRFTRKPTLLNLQKYAELRAPGWVCDASRLQRELGYTCGTSLQQGIAESLEWYRGERWL
ncbi:MAG TPA: NAD(P)-dependent oxidoreductase [Candidatus Acidoferrum sp.]|jgi:nucleoside-diphosphate-sugar epimerase|nr:NAD(P)-dependent oxidoreductase [Candidatus Acidoferrum sp.]